MILRLHRAAASRSVGWLNSDFSQPLVFENGTTSLFYALWLTNPLSVEIANTLKKMFGKLKIKLVNKNYWLKKSFLGKEVDYDNHQNVPWSSDNWIPGVAIAHINASASKTS